jgi:hypothetical protein
VTPHPPEERSHPEARTGLEPWNRADLPAPPDTRGLKLLGVVGPGAIVLGASIGSGEWLIGPSAVVKYGLSLLWVTLLAVFFQTIFNTELVRYTLYTGEPAFTGFMRTRPGKRFWAWTYTILYFLQNGWPGWAGATAGAIFFLAVGRAATGADAGSVHLVGVGAYLACVLILLLGPRRIERTMEILNWTLVIGILGTLSVLCVMFAEPSRFASAAAGFVGFDTDAGTFRLMPAGVDWFLIGAFAAYSGCGGVTNITLSSWARDKGYGMGQLAGYIPAAVGGHKVRLAHTGFIFTPDAGNMRRWSGWWNVVRADQWGVFFSGALLGMVLPAVLYVTLLAGGTNIQGLGISALLASAISTKGGALLGGVVAVLGAWILFKTQLDIVEGMVRSLTDILWTGTERVRTVSGGDVRKVYYVVLTIVCLWGMIALRLAQPITLIVIAANVASLVFVISSFHLLYLNTRLLPPALRPPFWRRAVLVAMAFFYATFVVFSVRALLRG